MGIATFNTHIQEKENQMGTWTHDTSQHQNHFSFMRLQIQIQVNTMTLLGYYTLKREKHPVTYPPGFENLFELVDHYQISNVPRAILE